jgi:hypothetical protein
MVMNKTVIPAGTRYDDGKKGPWVKLTWEEVDLLEWMLYAVEDLDPAERRLVDGIKKKLQAERRISGRTTSPV